MCMSSVAHSGCPQPLPSVKGLPLKLYNTLWDGEFLPEMPVRVSLDQHWWCILKNRGFGVKCTRAPVPALPFPSMVLSH